MSIALATKGIISVIRKTIYVPVEEPEIATEDVGAASLRIIELKPVIKAKQEN